MSKELTNVQDEKEILDFSIFEGRAEDQDLMDLNESDIRMPKIKILQSNSSILKDVKGARVGQIYNSDTKEAVDSIDCVVLFQGKSMVMWKEKFKRNEEPLCRSFDGKTKAPGTDGMGDGTCATCQYSSQNPRVWAEIKKDGDKTKPPCNMSYNFLAQNAATGDLFSFMAAGASVREAKDFMSAIVRKRIEPIAVEFTLTTAPMETDMGSFYVFKFENLRPNKRAIDPENYKAMRQAAKDYKDQYMSRVVQNDIIDVDSEQVTETENTSMF